MIRYNKYEGFSNFLINSRLKFMHVTLKRSLRVYMIMLALSFMQGFAYGQDCDRNWVLTRKYDENGNEIGASKSFFDNNGRPTQAQVMVESTGKVLASQSVYDLQGRAAVQTLAAPIMGSVFAYSSSFITGNGKPYSYLNFDGDQSNASNPYAKLNSPDVVDNSQAGTLGWYYSNNNTQEPMVGATGYPYKRMDFYHDGTGSVKRSSGIGEQLRMGTGREKTGSSFPVQHELDQYLAIRNQFFASASGASPLTLSGQAQQSLSTDENGTAILSVTDLEGKNVLMSGRAVAGGWLTVPNTLTLSNVLPVYSYTFYEGNSLGFPASILSIAAADNVNITITCSSCSPQSTVYTGPAKGYTYTGNAGSTYLVTSATPFSCTETSNDLNHFVNVDQAQAQLAESAAASSQYFRIGVPSVVTTTGSYRLYNMLTETDITASFTSGNTLPAGFYKITAIAPGTIGTVNNVTISYTNSYSDLTFNYYNQLGQLIASVAPKGVQQLLQSGYGSYTSAGQLPFITTYQYDLQGRLTSVTTPDGGASQFIYRKDGKIRFSQNAYQKAAANAGAGNIEKFSYTNYDAFGRPVESGEYSVTTATFAGLAANTTLLEATGTTANISGATKLSAINTVYDVPATNLTLSGYTQDAGFLKGAVSYTSNANSTTWYNYDDHGRISWIVKQLAGLTGYKTINYTYNDQGNVSTVEFQRGTATERFLHYYNYDADGKLINVQTSTDGTNMTQQAHYYYYLHGPLKRTELGDQLQGIDYVYTPQGWLKAMNTPTGDATKDPLQDGVSNSFARDAFGMQLEYFQGDYSRSGSNVTGIPTGTVNYYNGNVTGMSWQSNKPATVISTDQSGTIQNPTMYTYSYDPKYQYSQSVWGTPNYSNGTFTPSGTNIYQEKQITYDANGNILGLQRTNSNGTLSDNFSQYSYQPNTNKLNSVGNTTTPTAYASFTYDELGRLKSESKTGAPFAYYLKYDLTGKITGIYADAALTQLKLSYAYDETGNRISRTDNTGSSAITTYYVYDAKGIVLGIYTGSSLSEMPVYGDDRLGTYFTNGSRYVYEIRDNVGSVRVAFNRNKLSGQADIFQFNDYYPYGSIARSGGTGYRYDYQGAFAEKDPVTGFNNFDLRMYDSRIGRWLTVDPAGQYYSPYVAMGNNPTTRSDPDGGSDGDGDPVTVKSTPTGYMLSDITITATRIDHTGVGQSFINGFADPIAGLVVSLMHPVNTVKSLAESKIQEYLHYNEFERLLGPSYMLFSSSMKEGWNNIKSVNNDLVTGNYNHIAKLSGTMASTAILTLGTDGFGEELQAFSGTERAWAKGATPNSIYTQLDATGQIAVQNSIYDASGNIMYQVDFKPPGVSGHGHIMDPPGNIGSGHLPENHVPFENVPVKYQQIPDGTVHSRPLGQ